MSYTNLLTIKKLTQTAHLKPKQLLRRLMVTVPNLSIPLCFWLYVWSILASVINKKVLGRSSWGFNETFWDSFLSCFQQILLHYVNYKSQELGYQLRAWVRDYFDISIRTYLASIWNLTGQCLTSSGHWSMLSVNTFTTACYECYNFGILIIRLWCLESLISMMLHVWFL